MPVPSELRLGWGSIAAGRPRREAASAQLALLAPSARFVQLCPRCGGDHGPVRVDGGALHASVTYAGGLAIVAVIAADAAVGPRALGIDAEVETDPRRDAGGMRGVLGPETTTARAWTRAEAVVKADGRGIRIDPASVVVADEGRAGEWRATVGDGRYRGWDVAGPSGIVLSAAIRLAGAEEDVAGRSSR